MTDPQQPAGAPQPGWNQQAQYQQAQNQQPGGATDWNAPPPAGRSGGAGRLLIGVVIGLVVAVAVGAVLVVTNVISFSDDSAAAGPDTTPISLPTQLGDVQDRLQVVAAKAKSSTAADEQKTIVEHTYALTTDRYQQAFGGAAVAVRSYADPELEFLPTVIAVRAPSPGLVSGPVVDPADLGVAANPGTPTIQQDGAVECAVTTTKTVPKGEQVDPQDQLTTVCRRADNAVTVYVYGPGRAAAGHDQMVALANAAFASVTGGAQ